MEQGDVARAETYHQVAGLDQRRDVGSELETMRHVVDHRCAGLSGRVGDELAGDAGDGLFSGAENVGDHHDIGDGQGLAELLAEPLGA